MSNPIAIYSGGTVLYWSAIVISLGLLAALLMTISLHAANGGRGWAVCLLLTLTVLFSVPLCRALHWYCHAEQYGGLAAALRDYSTGSYVLSGALAGAWLAALIAARLEGRSGAALMDAFAPGAALAVAFIRLSALFNSSCRSKIAVTTPALQHLPLASGVTNSAGVVEYRFATFFVQFLLMLLICFLLLAFFCLRRARPMKSGAAEGNTARMFLLLYCAVELVLDSTRYDSSFLPINGFISLVQIVSALGILALLIYYSVHSLRANGRQRLHWLLWGLWLLGLAAVGVFEYLVQRHGDWFLLCYGVMTLGSLAMSFAVWRMYRSCCAPAQAS